MVGVEPADRSIISGDNPGMNLFQNVWMIAFTISFSPLHIHLKHIFLVFDCIWEFLAGFIPSILDVKLLDEVVKVIGKIDYPSFVNLSFYLWSDEPVWAYCLLLHYFKWYSVSTHLRMMLFIHLSYLVVALVAFLFYLCNFIAIIFHLHHLRT